MQNFRQFEAGPDPFGRKFQVFFKWLQTAISIRHSDTVDVKFILQNCTCSTWWRPAKTWRRTSSR